MVIPPGGREDTQSTFLKMEKLLCPTFLSSNCFLQNQFEEIKKNYKVIAIFDHRSHCDVKGGMWTCLLSVSRCIVFLRSNEQLALFDKTNLTWRNNAQWSLLSKISKFPRHRLFVKLFHGCYLVFIMIFFHICDTWHCQALHLSHVLSASCVTFPC